MLMNVYIALIYLGEGDEKKKKKAASSWHHSLCQLGYVYRSVSEATMCWK